MCGTGVYQGSEAVFFTVYCPATVVVISSFAANFPRHVLTTGELTYIPGIQQTLCRYGTQYHQMHSVMQGSTFTSFSTISPRGERVVPHYIPPGLMNYVFRKGGSLPTVSNAPTSNVQGYAKMVPSTAEIAVQTEEVEQETPLMQLAKTATAVMKDSIEPSFPKAKTTQITSRVSKKR